MIKNKISNLVGKTAIVTGASKGIGKEIARAFAEAGANVVVSSRKQEAVDIVAVELQKQCYSASGIACNMGNEEEIKNLVNRTIEIYKTIDIIVNNAAVNPVFGPVEITDGAAFDKIMSVNVKGPYLLGRYALPYLSKKGGSIINISSIGGISPEFMLGIYSVSKAAIISLTKVMAKEWGKDGIRANVICPGLIRTKFSQALWANEEILKHVLEKVALGRIGEPEDVAGLALFLASDASSFCTGGVYTADGGHTI